MVLKPKTLAAPAEVPPIVLPAAPSVTPTPLPRLSPLASVPKRFPITSHLAR